MSGIDFVERMRMAICLRQGGHHFQAEGMFGPIEAHEYPTGLESFPEGQRFMGATEACGCGMGRVLLWVLEDV